MFALNSKCMKSSDPQSFDLLWIRCLVVMILKTKNGATYTLSSTKLTSKRRPRGRRQANARVYLYCENISFITSPQFEVLMFHILSGCLHWGYANCVFSWILAHLSNCLDVWRAWRISSPVPVNGCTPYANQTRTTTIRFHCSALNFPPCLELKIRKNLNTVLY